MVVRYTFIGTLSALLVAFLRTLYSTHALMVLSVYNRGLQILYIFSQTFDVGFRSCCHRESPLGGCYRYGCQGRQVSTTTPAFRHFFVVNEYILTFLLFTL